MDRGLIVVGLQAGGAVRAAGKLRGGRVKIQDLVVFTRQLATMMDAGLPLVQSLTALEEQTESKAFKPVLQQVTGEGGAGRLVLGGAARASEGVHRLYVSMVEAGETGGLLAEILGSAWRVTRKPRRG